MRYADPRLVEHLASAYALGTLSPRARRRFERLRRDRADVAVATAQWEARVAQLAQSVPPVLPSGRVWQAIEARTLPAAARHTRGPGLRWLSPAALGMGLGGLATGVFMGFAVFLAAPGMFLSADHAALRAGGKLPMSYVGLLTDAQGEGKLLVSSLRHGRTMTIKVIGPIASPATGRLMLWAVPAQGAPFLLGPVPATGSSTSTLPDTSEKLLSNVRKLVVTAETADAPSAPGVAVYAGNCAKLW